MPQENSCWVDFDLMENVMVDVFKGIDVPEEDARTCATVLITADKRGIDSHGVNRLKPIYYDRLGKDLPAGWVIGKNGEPRTNVKPRQQNR